jgi:hypothetical protein
VRFPNQHFSVACLCNLGTANPSKRTLRVADIYLADLLKTPAQPTDVEGDEETPKSKVPFSISRAQLDQFSGEYWSEELGVVYRLASTGDGLKLKAILDSSGLPRANDWSSSQLQASKPDEFTLGSEGATLVFRHDSNSRVTGFLVNAEGSNGISFVRR